MFTFRGGRPSRNVNVKRRDGSQHDGDAPLSEAGKFVVRQIADAMWRLQRLQRMEDELMASSENPFLEEDDKTMVRLERLSAIAR